MEEKSEAQLAKEFGQAQKDLTALAEALGGYLNALCKRLESETTGERFRAIDKRIKPLKSVERALEHGNSKDMKWWELDDVVGARVVVTTKDDARTLAEEILKDQGCLLKNLVRKDISEDSGYRAVHLKGQYQMSQVTVGCEIQIRTLLEDAWAVVSRSDLYERSDLPSSLLEMARIHSKVLAVAEEALESIKREARKATNDLEVPVATPPAKTFVQAALPPPESEDWEDDELVVNSPISIKRVEQFKQDYLADRQECETLMSLFGRVGAFQFSDELSIEPRGFKMLLLKGPFVEGSRWVPYFTRQFAQSAERALLEDLGDKLAQLPLEPGFSGTWSEVQAIVGALWEAGKRANPQFVATLIVLHGELPERWLIDLVRWATPHWQLPSELQKLAWVAGAVGDAPILRAGGTGPLAVSVVDLSKFATLKRSREPLDSFSIEQFSDQDAASFLKGNQTRIEPIRTVPHDEALRWVKLHVKLELFEKYLLEVRDANAVLRATLTVD